MKRPSKIFINVDSEKFLHTLCMFSTSACMQSGCDYFVLFRVRSFLHTNIHFVFPTPFLSIIKFSLQVVFNESVLLLRECIVVSSAYKSEEHLFKKGGRS